MATLAKQLHAFGHEITCLESIVSEIDKGTSAKSINAKLKSAHAKKRFAEGSVNSIAMAVLASARETTDSIVVVADVEGAVVPVPEVAPVPEPAAPSQKVLAPDGSEFLSSLVGDGPLLKKQRRGGW